MGFGLICGCAKVYTLDDLGEEKIDEISACYLDMKSGEKDYNKELFSIDAYYGTYGGNIVFSRTDDNYFYAAVIWDFVIDGVFISSCSSSDARIYVYIEEPKEGDEKILRLDNAYNKNYLSKGDIKQVANAIKSNAK